ncbi:PP2C family protein-serine/threonine phosphatase [Granulicella arctica]|uniref:Sigma-B regulation protein RsbU (Phosphoserine phosphatase) n=1 Tax=Granulicella arctica TaxID=940613 RepID=A0A7Y9PJW9_9BACT|nr:SpoIIE family protein phosphatase [Granulicella arctica]NYF81105.1 sigma-B regulation protein RsbU (phosphoserine phosphatase) [Granulicella arctica]
MPTILDAIRQHGRDRKLPTGLAGAAFWLIVSFVLCWLLSLIPGETGTFFRVLQFLVGLGILGVGLPLVVRFIRNRMMWSLRNKLIITYLLIGLAPVVLVVTFVTISGYIAAGQFAIHLADTRVQAELDQIGADNAGRAARIAHFIATQAPGNSSATTSQVEEINDIEHLTAMAEQRSYLHLHRSLEAFINGAPLTLPKNAAYGGAPLGLPAWATELKGGSFRSVVLDGSEIYLVAIEQQRMNDGRLFTLLTRLPVNGAFMEIVAEGLGHAGVRVESAADDRPVGSRSASSMMGSSRTRTREISGGTEPPPVNIADIRVPFLSTTTVIDWDTGKPDSLPIYVDSRPSLLYLQLFGSSLGGVVTSTIRTGLFILCFLFVLIENLALVMAWRLSSTMTASVSDLYDATLHVDSGNLNHRIAVSRTDQLADLSRSFNQMTLSLQRLLGEQQEKERLQNELSIAQEVQANLFPSSVRDLPTLELHGVCRPARSVSGDYYDFIVFYQDMQNGQPGRTEAGVGIALGDISGKGISAALLMATLHSAVRAYRFASEEVVYAESSVAGLTVSRDGRAGDSGELFASPGRIMALLNRHLYRSTTPEKYATLFLAHYDAATSWLTYSNAGQLPPLLLGRDGAVRRLDKGGTVVGLMDGMQYEEGRFKMESGDILVAYSDGVTEPENDFGDFGEERLMEVVSRYRDQPLHIISGQVMQALDAWIGADEQPDDITLVLARQV